MTRNERSLLNSNRSGLIKIKVESQRNVDVNREAINRVEKKRHFNALDDALDIIFSIPGIIVMLIFVFIIGTILGLLPLILKASSNPNGYSNNRSDQPHQNITTTTSKANTTVPSTSTTTTSSINIFSKINTYENSKVTATNTATSKIDKIENSSFSYSWKSDITHSETVKESKNTTVNYQAISSSESSISNKFTALTNSWSDHNSKSPLNTVDYNSGITSNSEAIQASTNTNEKEVSLTTVTNKESYVSNSIIQDTQSYMSNHINTQFFSTTQFYTLISNKDLKTESTSLDKNQHSTNPTNLYEYNPTNDPNFSFTTTSTSFQSISSASLETLITIETSTIQVHITETSMTDEASASQTLVTENLNSIETSSISSFNNKISTFSSLSSEPISDYSSNKISSTLGFTRESTSDFETQQSTNLFLPVTESTESKTDTSASFTDSSTFQNIYTLPDSTVSPVSSFNSQSPENFISKITSESISSVSNSEITELIDISTTMISSQASTFEISYSQDFSSKLRINTETTSFASSSTPISSGNSMAFNSIETTQNSDVTSFDTSTIQTIISETLTSIFFGNSETSASIGSSTHISTEESNLNSYSNNFHSTIESTIFSSSTYEMYTENSPTQTDLSLYTSLTTTNSYNITSESSSQSTQPTLTSYLGTQTETYKTTSNHDHTTLSSGLAIETSEVPSGSSPITSFQTMEPTTYSSKSLILSTILSSVYTTLQEQTTQSQCFVNGTNLLPSTYNSQICPNNAVYSPNFLNLNNSYSFGYPIRQLIGCYGSYVLLECPNQQYIHIYSSYYGIQSSTNTNICGSSSSNYGSCFMRFATEKIISLCETKQTCSMEVLSQYFGEPCIGIDNRQLFIQYQCLDSDVLSVAGSCYSSRNQNIPSICPILTNSYQFQSYWCEPSVMRISCSSGTITILCVFYGIDPNIRCNYWYFGAPDTCFWSGAYSKVVQTCNNKVSCTINGDPSFTKSGFKNVCSSFTSMLFVQWTCSTSSQITTNMAASTATNTIQNCTNIININGSCPDSTFSPYEPKLLKNSTATFFSYPIYQEIACEGSTIVLKCPIDLVLYIYAGYYGIQSETSSNECLYYNKVVDYDTWIQPTIAYVTDAMKTIYSSCQSKNMCSLLATSTNLGGPDLFPLAGKQLLIQYQCVNSFVLNSKIKQCPINQNVPSICPSKTDPLINDQTWCDGETAYIDCGSQLISIICAFYGIDQTINSCGIPNLVYRPKCYFNSSFDIVFSSCDQKSSCMIESFTTTFDDACYQIVNALYIQWKCV